MPIKIEEGKSYVDRNGDVWDEAKPGANAAYPWVLTRKRAARVETFTEFGSVFRGEVCGCDLVAEYFEPSVEKGLPAGPHIIVGASDAGLVTHPGPFTHDEAVAKAKELAEGAPGAEFHIYQRVGGFVGKTTVEAL